MSEQKPLTELIELFEGDFKEILAIIKALGNKKRLRILILLLTGEKSFDMLKKETDLQKTATSNHLTKLMNAHLIEKPDHGMYKISGDGELFMRSIHKAYINSNIWEKKKTELLQRRKFSDKFVKSFFGKT